MPVQNGPGNRQLISYKMKHAMFICLQNTQMSHQENSGYSPFSTIIADNVTKKPIYCDISARIYYIIYYYCTENLISTI